MLNERGDIWKDQVRRRGPEYDQVDVFGFDIGRFHRGLCRLYAKAGRGFFFGREMAPLHSGSRTDPLITGLDDIFEILIRQYFFRQITAGTGDS